MRRQPRLTRIGLATLAAVLLFTGVLNLRGAIGSDDSSAWETNPGERSGIDQLVGAPMRTVTELDDQIVSLQDELRANPNASNSATALGHAYLQKARETGDPSYYPKAESLFQRALGQNDADFSAATGLGTLALARHQFAQALEWGERAKAINPYSAAAYGVIGDAQIELGRYDEAIATIQQMVDLRPELASFARVSYIRELHGDIPGAIDAMERAAEAGAARAENVAWTQTQIGNLYFNSGNLEGAAAAYDRALVTLDGYVYALTGNARIAAARGEIEEAVALYSQAIRTMPLPEFVIALGETYEAAGRIDEARQQYALVEAMIRLYAEAGVETDIELALFEADHGDDPALAVKHAQDGYAARPSVKSAGVVAWALYKAGKFSEAWAYSQKALALGSQDATTFYHAGMIAAALGMTDRARDLISKSLTVNPYFSPIHAPAAKQYLATQSRASS